MEENVDDLVLNNVNLIYVILKQLGLYNANGIDKYYDVGMVGLVRAAKHYRSTLGLKPSTFLSKCIRNSILMEMRKDKIRANVNNTIPLSTVVHENLILEDVISSDLDVQTEIENKEINSILYEAIKQLSGVEQYVLIHCFGLFGHKKQKQKDIAKDLDTCKNYISSIKGRAIKKLGGLLNEKQVKY